MLKAVLFDLDGTLLPLDQDVFTKTYIGAFARKMSVYYAPEAFVGVLVRSLSDLVESDGRMTNEELVNSTFASELGAEILDRLPIINEFYEKDFEGVKAVCGFDPKASEIVKAVRGMGLKTALATMPVFPRVATESRMRWAGLDAEDFELVTTLENSCFCKPNPNYYTDIAKRLGVLPEECLMVGNDTLDDMEAEEAGMNVFLLTDCLVNRENKDISRYENGGFDELLAYINKKMTV